MIHIRELREKKGMQQKELAIDLGVSQPTISDWESGRKVPSARSTQKIADYFDVSIDYLLGRCDRLQEVLGDMSDEEMVQRFQYNPRIISDYLEGKRKPLEATLSKIATDVGVNPDWLCGKEGVPKYVKPTPGDGSGLSAEQREIIRLYESAPPALKAAALAVLRSAEGQNEAQGGVSKAE